MENNKISGTGRKALLIITLVVIGIASGSIYLISANEPEAILVLDFINGKIILDAEDRELLKQEVIDITLENEKVKILTDGKNFTIHVTLVKSIQEIEEIAVDDSGRRIFIEFDYVAVVTLIFDDGSGYTIPVNWEDWIVGEPKYSNQVTPPESIVRVAPSERRSTDLNR
jgi:hypothetical protein